MPVAGSFKPSTTAPMRAAQLNQPPAMRWDASPVLPSPANRRPAQRARNTATQWVASPARQRQGPRPLARHAPLIVIRWGGSPARRKRAKVLRAPAKRAFAIPRGASLAAQPHAANPAAHAPPHIATRVDESCNQAPAKNRLLHCARPIRRSSEKRLRKMIPIEASIEASNTQSQILRAP